VKIREAFRRWQWPWDGATSIALAALILSLSQFVLTTPILIDAWWKPQLLLLQTDDGRSLIVTNVGNAPASEIEIELAGAPAKFLEDTMVWPDGGVVTSETDLGLRLVYPRLDPGEQFWAIIVFKDDVAEKLSKAPSHISLFRSAEGPGEIRILPKPSVRAE
jgi:hypothetical protein